MNGFVTWLRQRIPVPHPGIAEIVAWCDGKSGPTDARRVAMHLVTCARCRMHVELLNDARRKLLFSVAERGRVPHPRPSSSSALDRRMAAAVTQYFGARATAGLQRSGDGERELAPAGQALFRAFLGKRAAEALARQIAGTVAP